MRKAIVMPTINVPIVLRDWAAMMTADQDLIIVAGGGAPRDDKPHDEIFALLREIRSTTGVYTRYIPPEEQRHWRCSESMGWYSTTRRNIAMLEALNEAPDVDLIITLDDDNAPTTEDQLAMYESYFTDSSEMRGIELNGGGWVNPCELCACKNGWDEQTEILHRGFPLSERFKYHTYGYIPHVNTGTWPLGVFASLWTGAPDIDAIDRITSDPEVHSVDPNPLKLLPYAWAPFDSQSTVYRADLAPLMMCWPGVGRYDDIWASYLARHVMDSMGLSVGYGAPAVDQQRNPHDLLKDLEVEMFGMRYNDQVIAAIKSVVVDGDDVLTKMLAVYDALHELDFLPTQTKDAFQSWYDDITSVIER